MLCYLSPAALQPAIAQEETSLGEEEGLAGDIISDMLDDAEDESNQDATNTAAEDSNQGQTVDQDDISIFGDDTADLNAANVGVPLGIPIDVEEEEEEEPSIPTAPPSTTPPDEGLPPPLGEEPPPTQPPECPAGATFNPDTDQCVILVESRFPVCPVFAPTYMVLFFFFLFLLRFFISMPSMNTMDKRIPLIEKQNKGRKSVAAGYKLHRHCC